MSTLGASSSALNVGRRGSAIAREGFFEIARRRQALFGLEAEGLRESPKLNLVERPSRPYERGRGNPLVADSEHDGCRAAFDERACAEVQERRRERVYVVRSVRGGLAAHEFGGGVRSGSSPRGRIEGGQCVGRAEVDVSDAALGVDDHVVRREVPVNKAYRSTIPFERVHLGERTNRRSSDVSRNETKGLVVALTGLLRERPNGKPIDEGLQQERAVLVFAGREERWKRPMARPRERLRLALHRARCKPLARGRRRDALRRRQRVAMPYERDLEGAADTEPPEEFNAGRERSRHSDSLAVGWSSDWRVVAVERKLSSFQRAARLARRTRMISITDKAAAKVLEIAAAEDLMSQGLRLRVIGGGCAGFSYDLYFEDKPTDLDETFEEKGIRLYIDPLSFQYLDGTEIDYVEGAHGSGFKFGNPNVKGTCGCGSSFSA